MLPAACAPLPRLRLAFGNQTACAKLVDNTTTRSFIGLLPMTILMKDLYQREKYARMPGLPVETTHASYKAGDIAYWLPGSAFVIYYNKDKEPISGLVTIAQIETGLEMFHKNTGTVEVTVELIED